MAKLSIKRLGSVDSICVLPFESNLGLTSYRKYPPGPLAWNLYFKGVGTRNTYYIRLEEGLYRASHLRETSIEPFSLREYGTRCSSNFILIKSWAD